MTTTYGFDSEESIGKVVEATRIVLREHRNTPQQAVERPELRLDGFVNEHQTSPVPAYGCMRITGVPPNGRQMAINRPNAYGAQWLHMLNTGRAVGPGSAGVANDRWPALARYNPFSGTPFIGQSWGPVDGDWRLHAYVGGYTIIALIPFTIRLRPEWEHLVWVMPSPMLHLRGKTSAAHNKNATGTINVWYASSIGAWTQTQDHLTSNPYTITAWNAFANLSSSKWAECRWVQFGDMTIPASQSGENRISSAGFWELISGECG